MKTNRRFKRVAERVRNESWEMVLLTNQRAEENVNIWLGKEKTGVMLNG